jgi:signal transduction histidine kinase
VSRTWSLARRYWFDLAVVIAALASVLEVVLEHGGSRVSTTEWFTIPAVAVTVLGLLAWRRFPFLAPAALWLVAAAVTFVNGRLIVSTQAVFIAGLAAAFLLGNQRDANHGRIGLAIVLGASAIIVYNDPKHSAGELVFTPILFALGWLVGFALRERAAQAEAAEARASQAERERETAARIAVAEERARIARELHDIVAHSVSVMVVQAEAADEMLNRQAPERARPPVWKIQETGRAALTDMRRMLGLLREDDSRPALMPQPGIANLELLLAKVRESGLPVELEVQGRPEPLPPGVDLSAYRIVQEALTNSLRYAGRAHARVVVRYGHGALELEVMDDGPGEAGDSNGGHGLIGMRERVALFGGELDAGPVPGRGFRVRARLPLEAPP